MTMSDGNTCISGYCNSRTNSGYNLKRNASLCQSQSLFTTTPEDERVTALQPHYRVTLLRIIDEQSVNLLLFHAVVTRSFADIHAFRLRAYFFKQLWADQAIIDHHISCTQAAQPLDGNQIGVGRACSDQVDLAMGSPLMHRY